MGLGFDDLLPLLIEAGILKFSSKKCATIRSMEVKTDQIISLNAQFLNLAIKHTYRYMPDVCSMYTKFYFIGRGELGSKPVYGARVDKIKQISYSAKQRADILSIIIHCLLHSKQLMRVSMLTLVFLAPRTLVMAARRRL